MSYLATETPRQCIEYGGMALIPVWRLDPLDKMRRVLATWTRVSAEDADLVSQSRWYISGGYAHSSKLGPLARLILRLPRERGRGRNAGLSADHINLDKLDNRRENLRAVDGFGNARNRNGLLAGANDTRRLLKLSPLPNYDTRPKMDPVAFPPAYDFDTNVRIAALRSRRSDGTINQAQHLAELAEAHERAAIHHGWWSREVPSRGPRSVVVGEQDRPRHGVMTVNLPHVPSESLRAFVEIPR